MTLTIHTEELEQHQVSLSVAIAEERIETAFKQKLKSLAREVQIPGFRPGKAPASVIINRIGGDAIRGEVVDDMLQAVLEEALKQSELKVYDVVRMEEFVLQPTSFKVIVALTPSVDLGDYRSIRKEMPAIEISDEAVDEQLERVRESHVILESVDRPAELTDVVTAAVKGHLYPTDEADAAADDAETDDAAPDDAVTDDAVTNDDAADDPDFVADEELELIFEDEQANLILDPAKTFPNTPVAAGLVGASVGDTIELKFTFAEDYEEETLRGREAIFTFDILEVKRRELPELDDELAQLDGEHETLAELKAAIRTNLETTAQNEAESEIFDQFLEEVKGMAQVAYPPLLVEQEAEAFAEGIKKELETMKLTWPQYLEMVGQTEEALREQWLANADKRVHGHLILGELIAKEKLTVNQNDVMELLSERLARYEDPQIRNYILSMYLEGDRGRELRNEALAMKAQKRVAAIVAGQAPDLDALDNEDEEE